MMLRALSAVVNINRCALSQVVTFALVFFHPVESRAQLWVCYLAYQPEDHRMTHNLE